MGFIRDGGATFMRWFSQNNKNGSLTGRYGTTNIFGEVGVRHAFQVLYSATCACLQQKLDFAVWSQTDWSPLSSLSGWGPRPFRPIFSAETGHLESDVPGLPSSHTKFTALGAQRYSDRVLEPMPCTMTLAYNDNPSRGEGTLRAAKPSTFGRKHHEMVIPFGCLSSHA